MKIQQTRFQDAWFLFIPGLFLPTSSPREASVCCHSPLNPFVSSPSSHFFLQVFDIRCYQESLAPCFCLPIHSNINQIAEIILGETKAYVFFEKSHGDMHSFVRTCKKLKEEEAARLFYQIVSAVAHCHDGGVVLRDLKLRKFVFNDEER